jgi:hypothetical protein
MTFSAPIFKSMQSAPHPVKGKRDPGMPEKAWTALPGYPAGWPSDLLITVIYDYSVRLFSAVCKS